jgi:hypothetical protein
MEELGTLGWWMLVLKRKPSSSGSTACSRKAVHGRSRLAWWTKQQHGITMPRSGSACSGCPGGAVLCLKAWSQLLDCYAT